MLELEKHILKLLLNNDCVIVPNFGGFIAHHVNACYNDKEKVFLPPTRSIGFNPQLTMNDSLLAQSYVDTYDISYPEALKRISNSVEDIKQFIETEGEFLISGIGTITRDENSNLDFQPCLFPVITPSYYGLTPININPLSKQINITVNDIGKNLQCSEEKEANTKEDGKQSVNIRIPMSLIHQFVAVIIAIVMFVLFPSSVGDSSKSAQIKSSIDTNMLYRIMPREMTKGKPEKLSIETPIRENTKEILPQTMDKTTSKKYYSIVLASRVTRNNAEAYVKQLHKKGMKEAEVYTYGKSTKVIYKRFTTKEEATKALNTLTDNIEFSGCWVSEITDLR